MLGIKPLLHADSLLLQGNISLRYVHFFRPVQEGRVPYVLHQQLCLFFGCVWWSQEQRPYFSSSFLHHCKAKETSSKLSCPCTGGFSCWLTRGSGELGLLWVLLSLWRGVIWMMFVVPFSSTSFWFGPRAHFQIFCMALACVCERGDSTGFVSSSFNLPVPLHLRSPGLWWGLSELCSPSLAQVTCFSQQIQTVWSKDNKVVSICQLLQFFLPS